MEKARRLRARTTPGPVPARGPQGHITRGTTAAQRMRRVDRWLTDVHGPLPVSYTHLTLPTKA